ncbi:ABC transporter substrate-binding protein [Georgenia alba]|uniref:ABC transporter substrate-binding protein n=1 Tax=Georgenia alba TaxID=2233858 RepID=A0ABW2Q8A1_9MICO
MATNARKLAVVGAAGLATVLLAACGNRGTGDEASSMYTWISNASDRAQWEAFITAAQQEDPDFRLRLEGPSYDDYWTTVHTRMGAADAPCLLTTQAARAQELDDILMPLDDLAAQHGLDLDDYNDAMIDALTIDGTVRAIPYDAEPVVLYYNKDLFAEAGLEEPGLDYTTEQFLSDAQALTRDGRYGLAVPPVFTGGPGVPLASANGNVPVADGELQLTDPGFVEDMQFSFDLVAEHGVASPPQSGDPSDIHLQEFTSGNAAMIIDGPWFYETLTTETDAEVGIAVVPSRSGQPQGNIQGSGFGISHSCDDPEAAFEKIMQITTPEVVGEVGRTRGTVPSIEESVDAWAEGKPEEDVAVVETLLASGVPLETTPTWNELETTFTRYSSEGYRGNRSAEEILTMLQESVR